ncbi:MAG: glycerophosphodiester phosphodiesterase family protein [Hyphomicrobiales bacterium]
MNLDFVTRLPITHRGLHNAALNIIENSRGSVEAAVEHGYAIEIDVQLTKDGQAIVFHDESLSRLIDNAGDVIDFTLPELIKMTYKANGEKIISFAQLLEIVNGKVPLIVEVKSLANNIGPLEKHIADLIATYTGDICIMSFNPFTVREFRRIAPNIVRGIVAEHNMLPKDWPGTNALLRFVFKNLLHWPLTQPHFVSYHVHDLPKTCVKIARAFGKPIITWTVKSTEDAEHTYKHADQITFEQFLPKL